MPNIVISYRREDSKWIADRIFDRLEAHYGKGNVFMDIDSIPFGLDFREHLRETLEHCDVMLALVGPNWVGRDSTGDHILKETDWVRIEVEAALNKKIPLIPLLIDGSQMPKPEELPEALKDIVFRQSAAIDRDNFRAQMERVIASIDQHLSGLRGSRSTSSPPRQTEPLPNDQKPMTQTSVSPSQKTVESQVADGVKRRDGFGSKFETKFTIIGVGIALAIYAFFYLTTQH